MIYDYFRVTGAHDTVLDYTDLFTIAHRKDNVHEFDTWWDEILLSMTKIPTDDVLESLYKLRIRASDQLQTGLELYDLELHQKISKPDYQKLNTMVKRKRETEIIKLFEARTERIETSAVVTNRRSQRGVERVPGECWQWKAEGQCSKSDNGRFRLDENKRAKPTPMSTPASEPPTEKYGKKNNSRGRSPGGRSPSG